MRHPHPAILEAREVIALEQEREDVTLRRVYRAIMVAPTLTVCRALLNGGRVPFSRLDLEAVNRYGLREIGCEHCGKFPTRLGIDDINDIPDVRLPRRPAGHLEAVGSPSKSPVGRHLHSVESAVATNRESREA